RRQSLSRPIGKKGAARLRVWLCLLALLVAIIPPAAPPLVAQSGRARKPASPDSKTASPTVPRARRPAPANSGPHSGPKVTDAVPGQPATPDAQSASPSPTPATIASDPSAPNQATEIDPDEIVRVNANLVPITATVVDPTGKAVTNLAVSDFELKIDGQVKPIGELSRAETPVRMAVLFDNSGSARFARELERQAAIRFFRNVLRPVDRAAIFSISTDPVLEQSLTADVPTLVRTVESFGNPEGGTALLDTVSEAADYLRLQSGRKVIVIISDGIDTTSRLDFADTLKRVQAADCQVYAVQTGVVDSANLRDLMAERRLQDLTGQTGGAVYVPRSVGDLNPAFAQISADLSHQYVISYYPTEERRDNLFRAISVRVPAHPNARVRARRGYYPKKRSEVRGQRSVKTELISSDF
ncbi:MAG: VWA domain-containing protein, partial [Pyrinomonadaceae bacterium]|nr:VWA domain-containing protein [Pyrinomonadaceae bacterium]